MLGPLHTPSHTIKPKLRHLLHALSDPSANCVTGDNLNHPMTYPNIARTHLRMICGTFSQKLQVILTCAFSYAACSSKHYNSHHIMSMIVFQMKLKTYALWPKMVQVTTLIQGWSHLFSRRWVSWVKSQPCCTLHCLVGPRVSTQYHTHRWSHH